MARARNIKPGFFSNDLLAEINPLGRILFAGIWTIADKEGRLEDRVKKIKAQILPYDDCDCDALLQALHDNGFILRYASGEDRFIQVVKWCEHQNPHMKEAASTIQAPCLNSAKPESVEDKPLQTPDETGASPADSLNPITLTLNPITSSDENEKVIKPVELSIAMQKFGFRIQPADPRLIELARQGIAPETISAACTHARESKPGETLQPGYIFAIVKTWGERAAALGAPGSNKNARASPKGYQTASDKRKSWCDELLGVNENDQRNAIIDITPPARFLD